MGVPVGYGLPGWLDTETFLSADETRALGQLVVYLEDGKCCRCKNRPAKEMAHIARKGMGGQQKGKDGPRVALCVECHDQVDESSAYTMAVGRDERAVYWTTESGITRQFLGVLRKADDE